MRVAIIGSRTLTVDDPGAYLPPGTDEIVSGGARGVDACARSYAPGQGPQAHGVPARLPDLRPLRPPAPQPPDRPVQRPVLAFWDGQEPGHRLRPPPLQAAWGSIQALSLPIPCLISARSICSVQQKKQSSEKRTASHLCGQKTQPSRPATQFDYSGQRSSAPHSTGWPGADPLHFAPGST